MQKEIKPRTQEIVLEAIKKNNFLAKDICKKTGLLPGTVHNALTKLRKHGFIVIVHENPGRCSEYYVKKEAIEN